MIDKAKLSYKLHQLQKRVNRALKKGVENNSLKTNLRINRIKEIKKSIKKLEQFPEEIKKSLVK